jgi:hypothetical protein
MPSWRARRSTISVRALVLATALLTGGCAARFDLKPSEPARFDAVIVPGCPSEDDGALSRCQLSRAVWATLLWRRGVTGAFIVSGAAVHTRYVEAEALAQAMAALGVPGERIWIEPNALHTDENMFYSLQIARALGLPRLAVASQHGHAAFGCQMLADWGQSCRALGVDLPAVIAAAAGDLPRLSSLRTRAQEPWLPLPARERARAQWTGRRRPPSFLLYPYIGFLKLNGERWVPIAPARPPLQTWSSLQASLHAAR